MLAETSTDNLIFPLRSKPGWVKVILRSLLGAGKWDGRKSTGPGTHTTSTLAPALLQFPPKPHNFPGSQSSYW